MKTAGIIAEYNPFHTGHEYQIKYVKEKLGADFVVIAMSGDFVQRGTPALFSKYVRAEMALKGGADLILELPVSSSTASAELFAKGGVQLLDGIGVTDILCFGSECGDTRILMELAKLLVDEPPEFQTALRLNLKEGMTFPKARSQALTEVLPEPWKYQQVLSSPNNILGIEYCKAILREKSSISPVAIKREGNDYHEKSLAENIFPSASAIRKAIMDTYNARTLENFLPESCRDVFFQTVSDHNYLLENDLDLIYRYRLLQETEELLCSYLDMSHSLARRILSCRNQYETFTQFANQLKTKDITYTRIQRALLHMLLHIHNVPEQIPYARVLGFRKSSASLLGEIKKHSRIPLLTKLSDASKVLEENPHSLDLLEETTFSSNLYENILAQKKNASCIHEYQKQIIVL
nr:nucleotidyltransferase family protein [uncultured Blautia sp.]